MTFCRLWHGLARPSFPIIDKEQANFLPFARPIQPRGYHVSSRGEQQGRNISVRAISTILL